MEDIAAAQEVVKEEEANVDTKARFVFWGRTSCDNKSTREAMKQEAKIFLIGKETNSWNEGFMGLSRVLYNDETT